MNLSRREVLQALGSLIALWPARSLYGSVAPVSGSDQGNFRYIYTNPAYRAEFRDFLVNVFHLYPEQAMHDLLHSLSETTDNDEAVYLTAQETIGDIKPFLADLRYSLPALAKQKKEMAAQTAQLLDGEGRLDGYLEIGSSGRYLDSLEETLKLAGERFVVSEHAPTRSLVDILDRGQISYAGQFFPLADYRMDLSDIPSASVDLVTVYIGFHHCPIPMRQAFIGSIARVMRPGGRMIVRDHDVVNEKMWKLVALAHDVFNLGTLETWHYNAGERRHFYPLTTLDEMMRTAGFKTDNRRLLQVGDPTHNTLMLYKKA